MENAIYALLIVSAILSIVGFIWLLVVAFLDSLLIGLGTLLIPFFAIYTTIRNWPRTKAPLLLSLGSWLAIGLGMVLVHLFALTIFLGEPEVMWSEKRNVRSGPVTVPLAGGSERAVAPPLGVPPTTVNDENSPPVVEPRPQETPRPTPPDFARPGDQRGELFPASRIGDFVDRYITIVYHDGDQIQGTVERVEGTTITLRRRIGGGTISFRLDRSKIKELRVRRRIQ